jgi:hypothetical protein
MAKKAYDSVVGEMNQQLWVFRHCSRAEFLEGRMNHLRQLPIDGLMAGF